VLTNLAVAYAVAKFIHRSRIPLLESMAESVESELEVMKPLRKPDHQEQEQAEHYRSHSETRQRYRQMIPIELFKFIFLHVISLISTETGSRTLAHDHRPRIPSSSLKYQAIPKLTMGRRPVAGRMGACMARMARSMGRK
jgi:hypothetical protein